ncbi:MAG TPA: hypothetical protein VLK23_07735 [Thermodesulfobacteriota bacterium]|nr:hypothetical protein [Thermodesulfobacteriota bacterium]
MEKKECFGSVEEITDGKGLTTLKVKPECRDCGDFRDCLRQNKQTTLEKKEGDELRKQNLIAQIIDISYMISNELGSCLLDFLNRIYSSPLGTVLFSSLLLFCEIPKDASSESFSIPVSLSTLELFRGGEVEDRFASNQAGKVKEGFCIRIVLIQRHFPNNRKANIGLIAHEVTRMISSDQNGIKQILKTLSPSEIHDLRKMDADQRIGWLMNKWGFQEELEALKREIDTKSR